MDITGSLSAWIMNQLEFMPIKALTERYMQRLRRGLSSALDRAVKAEELPATAPNHLADVLRAGILGVQARARAGYPADALALLDGLHALLKHDAR